MRDTTLPSKRDLWVTGLLVVSVMVVACVAVAIYLHARNWPAQLVGSGVMMLESLFIVDVLMRTDYTLTESELKARCGVFRWRVPYETIQSVKSQRTWISGPALSMDRLVVRLSNRRLSLVISPEDSQRFLAELAERARTLTPDDGSLIATIEKD